MSACCAPNSSSSQKKASNPICPGCEAKGRKVDEITPKSLLTPQARAQYEPGQYYFCGWETCPIVYFNPGKSIIFKKSDVEVQVWQKEESYDPTVLVCYCFGHSEASIRDGQSKVFSKDVYKEIKAHVQAGRCVCEIKNPQGSCCMGNVQKVLKKINPNK